MEGPVAPYVPCRLLQGVNGAYGQDIVHELRSVVLWDRVGEKGGRVLPLKGRIGPVISLEKYVLRTEGRAQLGKVSQTGGVDKKTVKGIADAHPPGLRIEDYGLTDFQVTALVEIGVHYSCPSLYHRNPCTLPHEIYQLSSTPRDAEVYVAYGREHLGCGLVSGRNKKSPVGGDGVLLQDIVDKRYRSAVRVLCITSSLQDTGVAAFKA